MSKKLCKHQPINGVCDDMTYPEMYHKNGVPCCRRKQGSLITYAPKPQSSPSRSKPRKTDRPLTKWQIFLKENLEQMKTSPLTFGEKVQEIATRYHQVYD